MYKSHAENLRALVNLLDRYNIDKKDLSALSLVGFNTHVLADINDMVQYNIRTAIRESHVITANKLDSLYKHAREVDLFPTLSIPAEMDFILVINEEDFNRVASRVNLGNKSYRTYTINKMNYINVGGFIYSFDNDIKIVLQDNINLQPESTLELFYTHARYGEFTEKAIYGDDGDLPEVLRNKRVNDVIKLVRRRTTSGWELHLYLRLKQFARERFETNFTDRDYSAFNYTASGEIVSIENYFQKGNTNVNTPSPADKLDTKMYFETSRTSKDAVFLQFESANTFTIIHKSQESGFRPFPNDKLITHIFTTSGSKGNFTYRTTVGDDIKFVQDSETDLDVAVHLVNGKSSGGRSFINDKEVLRKDIITRKSTRDCIITENDLLMHINQRQRNNEHEVIKNRNDIVKVFNVFTTLKYNVDNTTSYYIPTNTLDVAWDLDNGSTSIDTLDDKKGSDTFYNSATHLVRCSRRNDTGQIVSELVAATPEELLQPLMEEFRLGISTPTFNDKKDTLIINADLQIPVMTDTMSRIEAGTTYYYNNRLYKCIKDKDGMGINEGIQLLDNNTTHGYTKDSAYFTTVESLYYWLPYYLTYVRSNNKNFIKCYDQTVDEKYDLEYRLNAPEHPYSFICNWARMMKPSIFNEYKVNINVRNNLTDVSFKDTGHIHDLGDGRVIDKNRLQVFFLLYDKEGNLVFSDKFKIQEYVTSPNEDDEYISYFTTLIPAGYIPNIIDDKITLYSELQSRWIKVPIKGLNMQIKIYDIDINDASIDSTEVMSIPTDKKTADGEIEYLRIYRYDNVPYFETDLKTENKYLINYYEKTNIDLLHDLTDLFKIQHTMVDTHKLVLKNLPMVQYTFYKHFAYLYHKAIKEEYDILSYIPKFQGEFSLSFKFTNTYGYSRYYYIGKDRKRLNNVQLDMSFLIRKTSNEGDIPINTLSTLVAKYVESIKFTNFENFHISKLMDRIYDNYRGVVDFIEFRDMNGYLDDNQLIEMDIDRLDNDTIIEKVNIPYTFNGDFNYKVNWTTITQNLRTDKKEK